MIDNGWGAAQNWDDIQNAAIAEIEQAGRQKQNITVLTSAPEADTKALQVYGPVTMSDALSFVRALEPYPWPAALGTLRNILPDISNARVIWLSDGIEKPGQAALVRALAARSSSGEITFHVPAPDALPLILKGPEKFHSQPSIMVDGPHNLEPSAPVRVQLLGAHGQIQIGRAHV